MAIRKLQWTGPHVVIIGGGFGGLEVAKRLAHSAVRVTLIDRRNFHLFQPMLYQVATAALSPSDIASPIRQILANVPNCRVGLGEVSGIDLAKRLVKFRRHAVKYDYLVVAAGATHSYFGNDQWAEVAPGLKSIENAAEIRRRILLAFESAEYEADVNSRQAALTFAVIGGGPTGVELAGAIKEIATGSLVSNFHYIDTTTTRVMLIQGNDRLLPQFSPLSSERAKRDLESLGVEVLLNSRVTEITAQGVRVGDQFIAARNVFWAAGVAGNPLARSLGVPLDRAGRVLVEADLSVAGHPEAFVIGDLAVANSADTGLPVPGVAQAAIQGGRHVARIIAQAVAVPTPQPPRPAFVYRDKGSMATIGKARAVAEIGTWKLAGFPAWFLWGAIHIFFLVGFRNRIKVFGKWFWNWLINARDARLILGVSEVQIVDLVGDELVDLDVPPP